VAQFKYFEIRVSIQNLIQQGIKGRLKFSYAAVKRKNIMYRTVIVPVVLYWHET
jgi:hypothetical protein